MIVIVDYGLGNISNVKRAIEHLGYEVVVSNTSKIIDQAETIILPGVGHFKDCDVRDKTIKSQCNIG